MVHYRSFLNSDPPQLLKLSQRAGIGRGLARPQSILAIDLTAYGLPYFDRDGLIVAEEDGKTVGFVHAGFAFQKDHNSLNFSRGVISMIIVAPEARGKGIGQALLSKAEAYLMERGATSIQAGQSKDADPFYFGIYGGARSSGFLVSDPLAGPFFTSQGYTPQQSHSVLQLDLENCKFPVTREILDHKRKTDLIYSDKPSENTLWWFTHFGNIDSMFFQLVGKRTGDRIASISVVGLDHYIGVWKERAIGLVDMYVEEPFRGQSFSLTLITETLRRLKNDMISHAEIHVPDDKPAAMKSVITAGFTQVDRGIVYQKEKLD